MNQIASRIPLAVPNPLFIAGTAVGLTISVALNPSILFYLLAVLGIAAVGTGIVWVLYHPQYIPEFLVAVAYLSLLGFKVSIAGLNLRPNMLVAFVGLLWAFRNKQRVPTLPWFVAVNITYLVSTLLHSKSPFFLRGIADCFLLAVNLLQYGIVAQSRNLDRMVRVLFCSSSAAYSGLVVLYLFMAAGFLPSLEKPEGQFVRLALLDPTPASYILFTLLALLCYLYLFGYPFSKPLTLWCLGAHCAALAFSYARAAWLSCAFAFICFWLFCLIRFPLRRALVGTAIILITLLPIGVGTYWYLSGDTGQLLLERAQAVSLQEGTVVARLILWTDMFQDWRNAPILGHGAHDYAKFLEDPTQISENYALELLHSGGLLTASLFIVGITILLLRGVPWRWHDAMNRSWSLPLVVGFVGMSLSALANPAMQGGIYWSSAAVLCIAAKKAESS